MNPISKCMKSNRHAFMPFLQTFLFLFVLTGLSVSSWAQNTMNYGDPVPPLGAYASFGRAVVSSPNPDIPDSLLCQDLKVVFVLDESGSIAQSGATPAVRDGVRALANALFNSGATLQIIEFASTSSIVDLGLNTVNTTYLNRLESYLGSGYNGQTYNPVGATNWQDALMDVEETNADLVVFFTDGFPTAYVGADGSPVIQPGSGTFPQALDSAIYHANIVKSQGKHMFVVGVGPGIDLPNIQAISGPDQFGGPVNVLTADYTTPPYEELANNLAAAVNTICGTELAITKTASAAGVCAGETVTFTSTLTNTGGSYNFDANNVVLTDVYPNGYSNLEILTPTTGASISGNTVTYPVDVLSPGQSVTLVVKAVVDAPPGNYNNVVTGTAFNANPVKDSASVISGFATSEIERSSCVPIIVNGQTYSTSGVYTQTLVSAAGCDSILTITFTLKTTPSNPVQCSGAGISCIGSCNGRASVSIAGSAENISVIWNTTPPRTTREISGLCTGTYTVKTTDALGCPDSCSVTIPNEPCGNFRTFTQGGYGATPKGQNVASYLKAKFSSVFPSGLTIGCNNKLILTNWQAVVDFLPSGSTARALPTGTLTNPGQSYQNVLAGQIAAATLNVKFDSASASFSPNSILLKDLIIASGPFSGWTISQLLVEANRAIGGCGSAYSFSGLNSALDMFNNNYNMSEFMNSPLNNRCFLSCPITVASSARPMASRENTGDVVMAQNALRVFPNPANEKINIRFAASSPMKVRMELLSTTGSKIIQLPATTLEKGGVAEKSIATAQLAPGMYYIKVIDEYGRQIDIQKVIVRK